VDKSEEADLSLPVMKELVEKTVLLTAQSINSVMYQRRLFALNAIEKDSKKAASQLKEKADVLKRSSPLLFGKDFHEYLTEAAKMGKKIKELQNALRPQSSSQWSSRTPFRKNPSSSQRNDGGKDCSSDEKTTTKNLTVRILKNLSSIENNFLIEEELNQVHPVIRGLFLERPKVCVLAGRLKFFQKNWEKITQDPQILKSVQGFQIPLLQPPQQNKPSFQVPLNHQQKLMVEEEIQSMLGKGAIKKVLSQKGEFLSSIFLVPKKDGGNRPVINLKNLNSFIPYQHFKMEGLHVLRDLIQEGDFMCKIDLKDAYFVVPIAPESVTTQRDSCVSSSKPGVCYKHQEVSCSPNPTNRIFGDDDKLKRNDSFSPSRKGGEDNTTVSSFKNSQRSDCLRPNQTNWSSVVISSCSFTSKAAISLSSEPTNTLLEKKSLFPMQSSFKPSLSSRIRMVDNKSVKLQ